MMERDLQASLLAGGGCPLEDFCRCLPLPIRQSIAVFIHAACHCHAGLAHRVGQNDQSDARRRQQLSYFHCLLETSLVTLRLGQWDWDKGGNQLQPARR